MTESEKTEYLDGPNEVGWWQVEHEGQTKIVRADPARVFDWLCWLPGDGKLYRPDELPGRWSKLTMNPPEPVLQTEPDTPRPIVSAMRRKSDKKACWVTEHKDGNGPHHITFSVDDWAWLTSEQLAEEYTPIPEPPSPVPDEQPKLFRIRRGCHRRYGLEKESGEVEVLVSTGCFLSLGAARDDGYTFTTLDGQPLPGGEP